MTWPSCGERLGPPEGRSSQFTSPKLTGLNAVLAVGSTANVDRLTTPAAPAHPRREGFEPIFEIVVVLNDRENEILKAVSAFNRKHHPQYPDIPERFTTSITTESAATSTARMSTAS